MPVKSENRYKILFFVLLAFVLGYVFRSYVHQGSILKPKQSIAVDGKNFSKKNLKLAQEISEAFSYVAEKASPAVVYIETEKVVSLPPSQLFPFDFFGDNFFKKFFSPPRYRERGAGSGFIISSDGYIVTNNHVIQGAQKITVKLADGRTFKAKVIGRDPFSDIALLKINAHNLPTLKLGNSDLIKPGQWVIAIGNPFGLTHTVTVGVISAKGRCGIGISDIEDFIQTDAAINPGNSGGPLLNLKGEVIGMNTAIFTRSGGYMGIGFAIPSNIIKTVITQLKTKGRVERGFLGVMVQDLTPALAQELHIPVSQGALITEVVPHTPAAKAGLREKDVIIKYDGHDVKNAAELKSYVLLTKPGTEVKLVIIRDGKRKVVKVKIASPKSEFFTSSAMFKKLEQFAEEIGIVVGELTPQEARKIGRNVKGVVIKQVIPETPADYAGLTPGMVIDEVNGKKIKNLREFYEALKPSLRTKRVLLGIRVPKGRYYVTLSLENE